MAARKSSTKKRAAARRSTATQARRKPAARTRRPVARTASKRRAKKTLTRRAVIGVGRVAAQHQTKRRDIKRARKDAAILRATHAGCAQCGGAGVIYKRAKDGSFAGSKSCPAKPKTMKVSKTRVAVTSRFGADKVSGLCGWKCPCGKRERPRYRDSKEATKALREHERKRHGGKSVGGTWIAQIPANAAPAKPVPVKAKRAPKVA